MVWRALTLVYTGLCGCVAALCLWSAFDEWRWSHDLQTSGIWFPLLASAFFAATAISLIARLPDGGSLAALSGVAMLLYVVAVGTLGWEDVGGAAGAIPLALGTGLFGVMGVLVGFKRE